MRFLFAGAAHRPYSSGFAARQWAGQPWHYDGVGGCPPGSRRRTMAAWHQARQKLYRGQRWQTAMAPITGYDQIPYDLRNRYDLDPRDRYYYGNGYLYQVDPRTCSCSKSSAPCCAERAFNAQKKRPSGRRAAFSLRLSAC